MVERQLPKRWLIAVATVTVTAVAVATYFLTKPLSPEEQRLRELQAKAQELEEFAKRNKAFYVYGTGLPKPGFYAVVGKPVRVSPTNPFLPGECLIQHGGKLEVVRLSGGMPVVAYYPAIPSSSSDECPAKAEFTIHPRDFERQNDFYLAVRSWPTCKHVPVGSTLQDICASISHTYFPN